ncbi:MAG: hypothetical protein HYZ75_17805 [Elusimicrobia bacterium]|nr:hypothetical protein [Elusimicrobiota bacterium]
MSPAGLGRRDAAVLAGAAAFPAAAFAALWAAGRTFFWGDLLYLHFPWRVLTAQEAVAGRLPLWNPFNYLGMPLAAEMQCAAWHPTTLPFHLAGFASGLAAFQAGHVALTAALWFLVLRRWGFGRSASAAGAVTASLGGLAVSRLLFLNHMTALAFMPAFLLFAEAPGLLALSLALSFLGGYPTMTVGAAAAAFVIATARSGDVGAALRRWAWAGLLAAGFSAVLLLPALELLRDSKRGGGMAAEETLTWSFAPRDLVQFTSPLLIPKADYDPGVHWTKTSYLGLIPCAAAALGAAGLAPAAAAGAAAYAAGTVLVILGGTNPVSTALWTHLPPLRYVRYPGNMAYLLLPLAALLVAAGLHRKRWAPWAALAVFVELACYAPGAHLTAPRALWTDTGPVVDALRAVGTERFAISPRALHWQRADARGGPDAAAYDVKRRLYGLSNSPYRLEEVGGFGEPLVPDRQYAFMDHLFSRRSVAEAAALLPWAGAAALVTPEPVTAAGLVPAGTAIWAVHAVQAPALRAAWLSEADGAALPSALGAHLPNSARARPLTLKRRGPGSFSVSGSFERPGWLYLAEPLGPGWRASPAEPGLEPALSAFWKRRVPAGPFTAGFRYEPGSFTLGLALTLASLAAVAVWYHSRLRRRTW